MTYERKQPLGERNALTIKQLWQVAEDDAQEILGVSADEAYRLIEAGDPRIEGTILEIELKNIAWLVEQQECASFDTHTFVGDEFQEE